MSGKGSNVIPVICYALERHRNYRVKFVGRQGKNVSQLQYSKFILNRFKNKLPLSYLWDNDNIDYLKLAELSLERQKIDYIVLCGFTKILPPEFVKKWHKKIINIHPSILPRYAGMIGDDIHRQVIQNRDVASGFTVHYVDEGVDTGEKIHTHLMKVYDYDTPESLKARIIEIQNRIYPKIIDKICGDN